MRTLSSRLNLYYKGKQGKGHKSRYLIKWKGSDHMTWEPKSHLGGALDLVKEYDKKKRGSKANVADEGPTARFWRSRS